MVGCLPYLTLPYLKLVYTVPFYIILHYVTPSLVANGTLKHTKTHSYMGKTEVTRRTHCAAGPYWALQSTLRAFKIMYKSNQFQQHSSQRAVLMCSTALHSQSVAKTHETVLFHRETKVRARIVCDAGRYWALKSTLRAPSSFQIVYKSKQFQPHSGQRPVLMCLAFPISR